MSKTRHFSRTGYPLFRIQSKEYEHGLGVAIFTKLQTYDTAYYG